MIFKLLTEMNKYKAIEWMNYTKPFSIDSVRALLDRYLHILKVGYQSKGLTIRSMFQQRMLNDGVIHAVMSALKGFDFRQ